MKDRARTNARDSRIDKFDTNRRIQLAADALRQGELVVFPTETVYGVGANALDEDAVRRIFEAKGRPPDNPLIVHLHDRAQLASVVATVPPLATALFDAFSPGPLTLVLPVAKDVPKLVTADLETVAVRFPRHPVARQLLQACRLPVAAPSANRSGEPSPTTVGMSRESLGSRVSIYVDGGPCEVGLESTVAACDNRRVTVLRPGAVSVEQIRQVLPEVEVVLLGGAPSATPPSPGLKHRHYQPSIPVYTWHGETGSKQDVAELLVGGDVAVICERDGALEGLMESAPRRAAHIRRYADLETYAQSLYLWFYELDRGGASAIIAEVPSNAGIGTAICDRLSRAATRSL
ncbi:MAG: L-threonylcarbamoyladenylate synthase [Spirochaetales bacterium]